MIDLDAYLERIGYAGSRAATPETLHALQRHHLHAIPFENLDVVLRRPIRLDPASLQRKLVADRRGGYCFESNGFFMHALRAMGFRTTALAARVLFERPETAPLPPRTHMLQKVDFDHGSYIVDVAFGGQTPAAPLPLEADIEHPTPRESCRLIQRSDGEIEVESLMGEWRKLYRFSLQALEPVDFEPANWLTSTHPESRFTTNLIAALPGEGCRYALFNRELRIRFPDGRVDVKPVADAFELTALLRERFTLALSDEDCATLAERFLR
ncbi:MAG TPA: arylamine N-acetyltransferase [Candidatus Cybelea sp.]|nr:arylamine N-acetyltransferase [Candidatus Cybelea sp.]